MARTGLLRRSSVGQLPADLWGALDDVPANLMVADTQLTLVYLNRQAKETLKILDSEIRRMFGIGSDQLVGESIKRMHSDPAGVERILRDPKSFPYHATIRIGGVTMRAVFNRAHDRSGNLAGYIAMWDGVRQDETLSREATTDLSVTAGSMAAAAVQLAANSSESSAQASAVAAGAEQMATSIIDIARSLAAVTASADRAVAVANEVNATVSDLGTSSNEIGSLVGLINNIANQTNLLALNATIEAARAGDAGAGFAVVAGEVKTLAHQTANASGDIRSRIESIQGKVTSAVTSMREMTDVVSEISDLQGNIAAAVEQQAATAAEIARNINIVAYAARSTTEVVGKFTDMATTVERRSSDLQALIEHR